MYHKDNIWILRFYWKNIYTSPWIEGFANDLDVWWLNIGQFKQNLFFFDSRSFTLWSHFAAKIVYTYMSGYINFLDPNPSHLIHKKNNKSLDSFLIKWQKIWHNRKICMAAYLVSASNLYKIHSCTLSFLNIPNAKFQQNCWSSFQDLFATDRQTNILFPAFWIQGIMKRGDP